MMVLTIQAIPITWKKGYEDIIRVKTLIRNLDVLLN